MAAENSNDVDHSGLIRSALREGKRTCRPVGIYLASRVVVLTAAAVAAKLSASPLDRLFNLWDASWYLTLAKEGYPTQVSTLVGPPGQTTLGF